MGLFLGRWSFCYIPLSLFIFLSPKTDQGLCFNVHDFFHFCLVLLYSAY
jgi:hypothetical protein